MFFGLGEKFSRLDLGNIYTGNIYILYASLYGQLKKGASYRRNGNTRLPEHTEYKTQLWDYPTIQNFMWEDS